jgi:hypothetical protein
VRGGHLIAAVLAAGLVAGCGETRRHPPAPLPPGARPVGPGPRFTPPLAEGQVPGCRPGGIGARTGAHLELFGDGLVVLFPAGIGTRAPRGREAGRIVRARCFGPVVTIDPSGLVLLRPRTRATVGDVFTLWGQPLAPGRAAGFRGPVRAYVNGLRTGGDPRRIPLHRHDEVVLEVGPYVPPHTRYRFPTGF